MNEQPAEHAFFRWVRSLGLGRGSDRWIGGVASGLAARTGLDPILVRGIVLIVIIFSGVGLFLYGAAWALLPGPSGRIHLQEVGRGSWTVGFTGALVLLILGTVDWFGPRIWRGDSVDLGGLLVLALVGGALWFVISRSRGRQRGEHPDAEQQAEEPGPETTRAASVSAAWTPDAPSAHRPSPGTAAHQPKPAKEPKPSTPPRPKHDRLGAGTTTIVLGVAVMAGGAILAFDVLQHGTTSLISITTALSAALAIMGVGLVAAAASKRTGGALTGWAVVTLIPAVFIGGFSANEVRGPWQTEVFSSTQTDLRHLASITEDTSVLINSAFSDTTVTVPGDIPVYLDAASGFAQVEVQTADGEDVVEFSGVSAPQRQLITDVTDGPALTLKVNGAFTSVQIVVDGDAAPTGVDSGRDGGDWPWDEGDWPWDDEPLSTGETTRPVAASTIHAPTLMETAR
ncbi:PspC domain-containing protein [Zhihengliuella flava]|uniref:Phage shock protein PspC (Stress-responsive transcriptional regulator) n=1 Tax=Zhihengliuella flava TaxID=1285193 RepID=A0A931DDA5_9MICC|nr:PspC domain-containing protein [Zhihengliuella flava]MBG6085361.1 phage shock protein PspC (stress-responsive transcriptional regulator) [Zhihengliuella flava]